MVVVTLVRGEITMYGVFDAVVATWLILVTIRQTYQLESILYLDIPVWSKRLRLVRSDCPPHIGCHVLIRKVKSVTNHYQTHHVSK